jgi:DNA repair protein RadA/Sms
MKKSPTQYLCTECGDTFAKWMGKCPSCGSWNTLKEFRESKIKDAKGGTLSAGVDLVTKEKTGESKPTQLPERISTGIHEIDRVLGGGFFPGSLTLFGGSPGVGKSTMSLQIFLNFLKRQTCKAFYFSGEESEDQVLHRAERLGKINDTGRSSIFSTNSLEDIIQTVEKNKPDFIVVDSIQMVGLENARLGNLSQIKINAEVLLKLAKTTGTTVFLIGHVTKSDEIAGPRVLEHIVDTTMQLEGERNSEIRILRSPKNRFGSTLEVGVFEMQGTGLRELKNPSEFFLAERAENAFGSVITVMREGARNFLIEIQALTVKTNFGLPRRTSHGVDLSKLHLLLAVISKFTPFPCDNFDAYINITSGMKVQEPASDLSILAAILSSRAQKEIPAHTIVLGEVGLSGEVRSVSNLEARLREAEKLGFTNAIVPQLRSPLKLKKMKIQEVKTVSQLVKVLFA